MTDQEKIDDYNRLKLEYTRLHEDFRILESKHKTKQLNILGVSTQRELLIAFHKFQQNMWSSPNAEITENVVDVFLSNL